MFDLQNSDQKSSLYKVFDKDIIEFSIVAVNKYSFDKVYILSLSKISDEAETIAIKSHQISNFLILLDLQKSDP